MSIANRSAFVPALIDELAQGLAYWAARYQPLPGNATLKGTSRCRMRSPHCLA